MSAATVWLLPSRPDPEMDAIEGLLAECHETAVSSWGDPRLQEVRSSGGLICAIERTDTPTWASCCAADVLRIDHHAPGDPGYGRPPEEFLAASSLGQVIAALARLERLPRAWEEVSGAAPIVGTVTYRPEGWVVTRGLASYVGVPGWYGQRIPSALVLTAAADHCLSAAYQGECPGVEPDDLLHWRVETMSVRLGRPGEIMLREIEETTRALPRARRIRLVDGHGTWRGTCPDGHEECPWCRDCACQCQWVADMRQWPPYPCLPDAAGRAGIGYIAGPFPGPDGRKKITCAGSNQQVEAFMAVWAPYHGFVGIYGDPARGFAGAYMQESG